MQQLNNDIVKTLMAAGAVAVDVRGLNDGLPFVIVPDNYKAVNLEQMLTNPLRKTGNVITTDTSSFIDYTKKHGSLDDCTIYADIDTEASKCKLVAIINDHGADKPQWQDYRCSFTPKLSTEWLRWNGKNRQNMGQADFATWLEDNLADIASVPNMPGGADILAMALGFEANSDKKFRSKINLQSGGVQFEFVEDETKETRTSMKVFERFTLGLPVFDGSADAYPLEARLKYREKSGSLTFWYELIRPDRVFKSAVTEELRRIKEGTGFPIISGRLE